MGRAETEREVGTDKRKKGRLCYVIGRELGEGPKGGPGGPCRERRGVRRRSLLTRGCAWSQLSQGRGLQGFKCVGEKVQGNPKK